jgi:hypothetical protein
MTTVGFCTHFSKTDEWAFEYALNLARMNDWHLNICHWLESPYRIRRDIVFDNLFDSREIAPVTPGLLARLELQLREYYEPQLGDFTEVGFRLCEGGYQIELIRCFRNELLDVVIMGYQPPPETGTAADLPLEDFAEQVPFPFILVGVDGPNTYLINSQAAEIHHQMALPEGRWRILQPAVS